MERRRFLRALGGTGAAGLAVGGASPALARDGGEIRRSTGDWAVAWRTDPGEALSEPYAELTADGDDLFVAGNRTLDGVAVARLDGATGRQHWEATTHDDVYLAGVAVDGDAVVVLDTDRIDGVGVLRAVERATGDAIWETDLDGEPMAPPEIHDGRVFVPLKTDGLTGELVAVDVTDGTVDWRLSHEDEVTGSVVDDDVLYTTTTEGAVAAVDPERGERVWRRAIDGGAQLWSPTVEEGTLVATVGFGGAVAVTTDGTVAWKWIPSGYRTVPGGSVVVGDGRCFTTSYVEDDAGDAFELVALSMDDGSVAWRHRFRRHPDGWTPDETPPDLLSWTGDRIWAVGPCNVVGLSPEDGTVERRLSLPGCSVTAPLVTDERVLVANDRELYAFDRTANDCEPLSFDDEAARIEFPVPSGRQLIAGGEFSNGGDCTQIGVVEVIRDGELLARASRVVPASETVSVGARRGIDGSQRIDAVTIRARDTGGSLVAEREVSVQDYRDEPASFDVVCSDLAVEATDAGKRVTASLDVRNHGSAPGYEAALVANDETVATDDGSIPRFLDDNISRCEGQTVQLSHEFETSGTYDLRASIEPSADEGSGDTAYLDSVDVGSDGNTDDAPADGLGNGPATVGLGAVVVGALARAVGRFRRE